MGERAEAAELLGMATAMRLIEQPVTAFPNSATATSAHLKLGIHMYMCFAQAAVVQRPQRSLAGGQFLIAIA